MGSPTGHSAANWSYFSCASRLVYNQTLCAQKQLNFFFGLSRSFSIFFTPQIKWFFSSSFCLAGKSRILSDTSELYLFAIARCTEQSWSLHGKQQFTFPCTRELLFKGATCWDNHTLNAFILWIKVLFVPDIRNNIELNRVFTFTLLKLRTSDSLQ